jgi:hypothetical protein
VFIAIMFSLLTVQIHFLHFRLQNLSLIMYVSPSEQTLVRFASHGRKGPGGSMSYVIGLPNNSYKPIFSGGRSRSTRREPMTMGK